MRRDTGVGATHRLIARVTLAPLLLSLLLLGPAVAHAEIGVGTDIGKIALTDRIETGGSYDLPVFKVINTGTEPTGYIVKTVPVKGFKTPAEKWFTFEPSAVYLGPSESAVINVKMDVPANAAPGEYQALLVGEVDQGPAQTSGARVNIGAGPRLDMTIVQSGPLRSAWYSASSWFIGGMPWTAVALAVLLVVAAAIVVVARKRGRRLLADPAVESVDLENAS